MDTEANQNPKQERATRKRWTATLDKVLADLVVKQIKLGNRHNNIFDRKTWTTIRDEFNEITDLKYNNNQLRKHLDVLRIRYTTLKSSSSVQNEFGIDDDTRCILGFDLWEEFGVQPRSEPVKVKDCPIYEQLRTIFGEDSADGKYAQSSHFEGLEESAANLASTTPTPKPNTNSAERKRKREPEPRATMFPSQIDQATLETMAVALSDMVTSLKSRMADSETLNDNKFSIANCIKALDEIENVDESVYFTALDLFENPGLRETFMSLKARNLRLTWLKVKCKKA